jgi:hypothetical protein
VAWRAVRTTRAPPASVAAARRRAPRRATAPRRAMRAPAPLRRVLLALATLALAARAARAQTYTNENIAGVTAYSAFAGAPSTSAYRPYAYAPPPADLSRCGGTCVPVAIAGNAAAGYWLTRGGVPYWIKCGARAARRARRALRRVTTTSPRARPPLLARAV